MSHQSANFNTLMTDAMLEQIRGGDISKTAKLLFDRELRKRRPEWKGIDHEGAISQLESSGAVRHAFSNVASLDQFQKRGFPNMAETRHAVTDPSLLDVPIGQGGQAISRPSGQLLAEPAVPHKAFNTVMAGDYLGGLPQGIPRDILFPDFTARRRAAGTPVRSDPRSFELSTPTQVADQQWLDRVMAYLAKNK
jgi:hypothetical protein